jgi:hypothetical protein
LQQHSTSIRTSMPNSKSQNHEQNAQMTVEIGSTIFTPATIQRSIVSQNN